MWCSRSCYEPFFDSRFPEELYDFFEDFEELAKDEGLGLKEMAREVVYYTDRKERRLWKSLDGYDLHYEVLKKSILFCYSKQVLSGSKFLMEDLSRFISQYTDDDIRDEEDFESYYRRFWRRAEYLLEKGAIDDDDCDEYFWRGLPSKMRGAIRSHLGIRRSCIPMLKRVLRAGRAILPRRVADSDSDSDSDLGYRDFGACTGLEKEVENIGECDDVEVEMAVDSELEITVSVNVDGRMEVRTCGDWIGELDKEIGGGLEDEEVLMDKMCEGERTGLEEIREEETRIWSEDIEGRRGDEKTASNEEMGEADEDFAPGFEDISPLLPPFENTLATISEPSEHSYNGKIAAPSAVLPHVEQHDLGIFSFKEVLSKIPEDLPYGGRNSHAIHCIFDYGTLQHLRVDSTGILTSLWGRWMELRGGLVRRLERLELWIWKIGWVVGFVGWILMQLRAVAI